MRAKFVLLIGGIVLLIAVIAVGAVEYTTRPAFCNSCHEMNPMYESWKTSAHKGVNCIKCHANPGLLGLVSAKLGAVKDLYYHITGTYKKPITVHGDKTIFNKRCLVCHGKIPGSSDPHNKTHFSNGMACIDCHKGLVHDKKTNQKPPSREICKNCHG